MSLQEVSNPIGNRGSKLKLSTLCKRMTKRLDFGDEDVITQFADVNFL
jgi:hypothetical protein